MRDRRGTPTLALHVFRPGTLQVTSLSQTKGYEPLTNLLTPKPTADPYLPILPPPPKEEVVVVVDDHLGVGETGEIIEGSEVLPTPS